MFLSVHSFPKKHYLHTILNILDNEKGKIVLYYSGDITDKDIAVELRNRLPRYMIPNLIIKLDSIPMTANGKIDRVSLKKMYSEQ